MKPEVPAYVAKSRFHKGGANAGLRAFGVAKLLGLKKTQGQVSKLTRALQWSSASHHCIARLELQSSSHGPMLVSIPSGMPNCLLQRAGSRQVCTAILPCALAF